MGRRRIHTRRVDIVISPLLLTVSRAFLGASDCVSVQIMLSRLIRALLESTEERTTSSVRHSSAVCTLGMLVVSIRTPSKNARLFWHWNILSCSIFS